MSTKGDSKKRHPDMSKIHVLENSVSLQKELQHGRPRNLKHRLSGKGMQVQGRVAIVVAHVYIYGWKRQQVSSSRYEGILHGIHQQGVAVVILSIDTDAVDGSGKDVRLE